MTGQRMGFAVLRRALVPIVLLLSLVAASAANAEESEKPKRYIVVLKESVRHPANVAARHEENRDADLSHVYRIVIKGYAAEMTPADRAAVEQDPNVAYVESDARGGATVQTTPTGIKRVFAAANANLSINAKDDQRVDVDVAVLDTPIDFDHPDLHVVDRVDCLSTCVPDEEPALGYHGTHVAGTIGALDNDFGVAGVSPGARLWGVGVLTHSGSGEISDYISGVEWVTKHADEIEVANSSLRFFTSSNMALKEALEASVDAGVVHVVAAGNESDNAANYVPANHPDVITVSAVADFNGQPGGKGTSAKCEDKDDTSSDFSNWGSVIDIAAPGSCILSTWPFLSGYAELSGTSMAAPHVSGAAAILASVDDPTSQGDVNAIKATLIEEGNYNWEDEWEDGVHEPLLDVGDEAVFKPRREVSGELVAVDSSGTVNVFTSHDKGFYFGPTESLENQLDPALLDGEGHYVVDVADVGNDGLADLIAVEDDGSVLVYAGEGDQTFGEAAEAGIVIPPSMNGTGHNEPIAVADVSGDGFDDLVVSVGPNTGHLAVYKGTTEGTFETTPVKSQSGLVASALTHASGYYYIDAADIDGDGRADLLAQSTAGSLIIWLGKSNGEFGTGYAPSVYAPPIFDDGSGYEPLGVGDVDGDGRADLLALDGETLKLFKGKSDGKLEAATEPYAGEIDSSLLDGEGQELIGLLDFNADARQDLVALEDGDLLAYEAQGGGTFDAPLELEGNLESVREDKSGYEFATELPTLRRAGCQSDGCSVPSLPATDSDVDGDGRADVVTIMDGTVHVYPGAVNGAGGEPTVSLTGEVDSAIRDGAGHYAVDVADVDGDKRSDLVTVEDDGQVFVHSGQADRTFEEAIESGVSIPPAMNEAGDNEPIAVADVTGDRRGDLVVFVGPGTGHVEVYAGQANGEFSEEAVESLSGEVSSATTYGSGLYFLDVADVNDDGHDDLIALGTNYSSKILTFKGKASGQFEAAVSGSAFIPSLAGGPGLEPLGAGDVNGDGFADFLATNEEGKPVIYKGGADGKLTYSAVAYGSVIPSVVGVLDYNHDGFADLVSAATADLYNYKGKSNGTFEAPKKLAGPTYDWDHEFPTQRPLSRRGICTESTCYVGPPNPDFPHDDLDPGDWSAGEVVTESSFEVSEVEWDWRLPSLSLTGECLGSFSFVNVSPLYVTEADISPDEPAGDGLLCSNEPQNLEWELSTCRHEPSGETWLRMSFSFGGSQHIAFGRYVPAPEEGPAEASIRFGNPQEEEFVQVNRSSTFGSLQMQLELPLPGEPYVQSIEEPDSCVWAELNY